MTMTKYQRALQEVRSVLGEWADLVAAGQRIDSPFSRDIVSKQIVDRLVAKGVIQSVDEDDLREVRTGPLAPGRTVIGGDRGEEG
jgi:hypothetical protein